MEHYWKIFTIFLLIVIAGIILFLRHDYCKRADNERDTIHDTIIIYRTIEVDADFDDDL
jgi:hypothetical protein